MSAYPTAPQVGVGVVVTRGAAVLLIRRAKPPGAGAWSLPGGRQELGETAEAAARRELLEETGLTVGTLTLIGHADSIHRDAAHRIQFHYTILDFHGEYAGGEARAGDDAAAVAWVQRDALDDYGLWEDGRRMVLRAFARSPR